MLNNKSEELYKSYIEDNKTYIDRSLETKYIFPISGPEQKTPTIWDPEITARPSVSVKIPI